MKTRIHILTAFLLLFATLMYAGDPLATNAKVTSYVKEISFSMERLAPVTPKEATFEDEATDSNDTTFLLAPVTPPVAEFE